MADTVWADVICDDSKAVAELLAKLTPEQAAAAKIIYKEQYRSFTVFYPEE